MARKITYDQEKVKELRMKVIEDSLMVFSENEKAKKEISKWSHFRKDLLMKYAPRVLPNLIAGKDDDSNLIPSPLLGGKAYDTNNHSNKQTTKT